MTAIGRVFGSFTLLTLLAALPCGGCKREAEAPKAVPVGFDGIVRVAVDQNGYEPSAIAAPAGKPITLILKRTSEVGCGDEVVFPAQGIRKPLPLNEEVTIKIMPTDTHEIQFTCGMGMYKGAIVVSPS